SAKFVISNTNPLKGPTDNKPEYAFIGRSNVGKSSLINCLTARKGLAMTSATPGKTMLINHFDINDEWYLVDLPGYGYAKLPKKEIAKLGKIIDDYVTHREQLTCLFVLVDSRLTPQKIDIDFINHLGELGIPFSIIFTKSDKISKSKVQGNVETFLEELLKTWESLPPHFVTSSQTGLGREDVLNYIESINRELAQ
ncbi:MAG: YihA family ribosome biogenesis GTP-binding protein, partial [Bacteroidaceae bacterium]|nr:YihA family ribosome biogenesis GTP-binding protein [Bacteroidaceae bacterium]